MLQMYCIFDKKGQVFERPFFCKHVAEATRAVQAGFRLPVDQQPWYVPYPADYALYLVGTFDQATGATMKPQGDMPQFTIEVASLDPAVPTPTPKDWKVNSPDAKKEKVS